MVEVFTFAVAAIVCLAGALGVVLSRNPVHAALSLVATLFGVAVLFLAQEAHFLAAIQVIVYAGAIVVLFLFVIMFLGVDEAENLRAEPLVGQRTAAAVLGIGVVALVLTAMASTEFNATGARETHGPLTPTAESSAESAAAGEAAGQDAAADADADADAGGEADVNVLGEALMTDYVFAVEVTSLLLTIAVVGAVVMSRMRTRRKDEIVDPGQAERAALVEERIHDAEARTDLGLYLQDRAAADAAAEAEAAEDGDERETEEVGS